MPQLELLEEIVKLLSQNNIQYMLTGSIVSSLQGVPRSTHDIDIIISIKETNISAILKAFPKKYYYINENSIKSAVNNKGQFNIIDKNEGDKIDFWILTDRQLKEYPGKDNRYNEIVSKRKRQDKLFDVLETTELDQISNCLLKELKEIEDY